MKLIDILNKIDNEALTELIETETVYESKMLKAAFSDISIIGMPAVELYRLHFALFHHLYTLQNSYAEKGKYMHIHFMRTGVYDYPPAGECAYFDEQASSFCCHPVADGASHCPLHSEQLGDSAIESLSLKYFYLDAENYDRLDSVSAESLLSGSWEILSSERTLEDAYVNMGLHGHENLPTVKQRFRELCKKHHPDQGGDLNRFMDINRAYRMITKWFETSEPLK